MPILYSIVPNNDGHHVLGTNHQLIDKADFNKRHKALWFIQEKYANAYIQEYLDPEQYSAEEYWTATLVCPMCGADLICVCTDHNGIIWYSCSNEECDMDYNIKMDNNEHILDIKVRDWRV